MGPKACATRRCPTCLTELTEECPLPYNGYGCPSGMLCQKCGPTEVWIVFDANGRPVASCTMRRVCLTDVLTNAMGTMYPWARHPA